jgi:ribulose-phosphate 3-epimerase
MSASKIFQTLRAQAPTLSVGMMTCDLLRLGAEIELLEATGVPLVHFDVMDGVFCPASTVGSPIVKAVRTALLKDVHLMVEAPLSKVGHYVDAGADIVTVHLESERYVHRVFQELGARENANDLERGLLRGLALNPGTPVEAIEPLLGQVELILLLAINPGWGGQSFSAETPRRLERARELVEACGRDVLLGVDGGVTRSNIGDIAALGPDIIVTGSAIFDGKAPAENAEFMLEAVARAAQG